MKIYLPIKGGVSTHLEVKVFYNLGGMNYFTGETEQRGVWISVQPVEKTDVSVSFTAFTGVKTCVEVLKRKSQKTIIKWEERIKLDLKEEAGVVWTMIEKVMQKTSGSL